MRDQQKDVGEFEDIEQTKIKDTNIPPEWKLRPDTIKIIQDGCDKTEQNEWVNRGIVEVPISSIDDRDCPIKSYDDFHKVSHDQMKDGLNKLESDVRPAVKNGANGDYFSDLDQQKGLDYEHGYRRVYDAFYGNEPIRLDKDGDTYSVINGYHRLFTAKEMGFQTIPSLVNEKIKDL
jgi:hypothetical protein